MVNTAIFMLTFICLLLNSLFICLKSEIFTYCLEWEEEEEEEEEEKEEEEEPLLIYIAQGSPFRRKKLSVISTGALSNNAQKPH